MDGGIKLIESCSVFVTTTNLTMNALPGSNLNSDRQQTVATALRAVLPAAGVLFK